MRERLDVPQDLATLGGSTNEHLPGYLGMVKRLDEAFGRLVEALHSLKLLDDTIILFTSDHGCHFKTRNDRVQALLPRGVDPGADPVPWAGFREPRHL